MDFIDNLLELVGNLQLNVTLALIVAIVVASHFYYKNAFTYWHNKGIKGPKPLPFAGNFAHLLFGNTIEMDLEWARKYGRVYGIYQNVKPVLVVSDADVLRQICIKDFDVFPNHDHIEFPNKYQGDFVFTLRDERWKRVRAMMTPTFTSGKIRRMYYLLQVCGDDLIQSFQEQLAAQGKVDGKCSSAVLNLKDMYSLFTMDAIASCCYGLKLERLGANSIKSAAARNEFVRIAKRLFELSFVRFFAFLAVPKKILQWFHFEVQPGSLADPLAIRVEQFMNTRRKSGRKFDDYLQILLDAKLDDKMELDATDIKENHHAGITSSELIKDHEKLVADVEKESRHDDEQSSLSATTTTSASNGETIKLSDMELLSNATFLLIVGLETTATLLTNCSYILAFHQEIQDKLYEEIKPLAKKSPGSESNYTFDYDELTSCHYLDAVISETLRYLAPIFFVDRVAEQDYLIEKYNIQLNKDSKLHLNYYSIMNDPEYWSEPRKFNPDRFMPENRDKIYPGSYCPFGLGPRHCLGMRFSLTESKLALAKVLMSYRFEPAPGEKFPPRSKIGLVINSISRPLARVVQRC